jgi:MFS family permease
VHLGLAKNYAVLAFARAGVGIGEAGCSPTATRCWPTISRRRSGDGAGHLFDGISIGTLWAWRSAGIVAEHYGWRTPSWWPGVPGLIFACIAILTLREPRNQLTPRRPARTTRPDHIPLWRWCSPALEQRPTFWLVRDGRGADRLRQLRPRPVLHALLPAQPHAGADELAGQFGMAPAPASRRWVSSPGAGLAAGIGGAFGSWLGGEMATAWAPRTCEELRCASAAGADRLDAGALVRGRAPTTLALALTHA